MFALALSQYPDQKSAKRWVGMSDQAMLARSGWQKTAQAIAAEPARTTLLDTLRQSTGGKNLVALGLCNAFPGYDVLFGCT